MDYENEIQEEVEDDGLNDLHVELVDDGIVMSGGELEFKSPSPKGAVVEGEGEGVKMSDEEGHRKTEVIPFYEGSIGSSCGSHRSKLRLCLEMNIKSKLTGRDIPEENSRTDVNSFKYIFFNNFCMQMGSSAKLILLFLLFSACYGRCGLPG